MELGEFISNMYELLSIPNRNLIKRLIIYGYISYSEMHLNLGKLFCCVYYTPIECSSLSYIINSLVTSYLKTVVDKSLKFNHLKHRQLVYPSNVEHDYPEIIMTGLRNCFLQNFQVMNLIALKSIETVLNVPVEVVTKSEIVDTTEKSEKYGKEQILSVDSDFQLPLKQAYTKSNKGYKICATAVNNTINNNKACNILKESEYLRINNANNYSKNNPSDCYLYNFQVSKCIDMASIETVNVPVDMCSAKSEIRRITEKGENNSPKQILSIDKDFKSFLLPLEQDYTKSSKGYNSYATSINDSVNCKIPGNLLKENKCVEINDVIDFSEKNAPEANETSHQTQTKEAFQNSDTEIIDDSDIVCYLQNYDIHTQQKSNKEDLADQVKQQLNDDSDSTSDISLLVNCNDSDNDNSIIVPENVGDVHVNDVNMMKFWSNLDSSSDEEVEEDGHRDGVNRCLKDDNLFDSDRRKTINTKRNNRRKNMSSKPQEAKTVNDAIIKQFPCDLDLNSDEEDSRWKDDDLYVPDFKESISANWNNTMKDVSSEPQQAERVNDEIVKQLWSDLDLSSDEEGVSLWDDCTTCYEEPDLFETFSLNFRSNDFPSNSSCLQSNSESLSNHAYVNACFEDDFVSERMKSINANWNNTMKDVSSEPREAKKVSFVPSPELVSVRAFESDSDGYSYSEHVINQVLFRNRVEDFEMNIAPYLTSDHRAKVYYQIYQQKF